MRQGKSREGEVEVELCGHVVMARQNLELGPKMLRTTGQVVEM